MTYLAKDLVSSGMQLSHAGQTYDTSVVTSMHSDIPCPIVLRPETKQESTKAISAMAVKPTNHHTSNSF